MINSRMPSNLMVSRIANDIVQKQYQLADIQEKISTGKDVNRPSDDPAQAARLLGMREASSQLDQYQRNASIAESQLSLEENALVGVSNTLNRIRELALSSNNGVTDDHTRESINAEVKVRLSELYDLANTRDSLGNYVFGGNNNQTAPFSGQNPVTYSGGDDNNQLTVGLGRKMPSGDSGIDVFMRIRKGNGDFEVNANPANTGTGLIAQGLVTDTTVYDATPYRIEFTAPDTFNILNDDTGAAIQSGVAFSRGEPIAFNGVKTDITGQPNTGDEFYVRPSTNQDIFSTISNFTQALDRSPTTPAESARMQQDVNEVLLNLDMGLDHINITRAKVGTRLASLDSSREENAGIKLQLQRSQADVEDIDIAEAVSSLQNQANTLEIVQKSFARIENLSVFNYL